MNANDDNLDPNDYPIARALNSSLNRILFLIRCYQVIGKHKEFDPDALNRVWIFLVDELEKIYDRNPKLSAIKPEPLWREYDIIRDKIYVIQKYLEEHEGLEGHMLKIEKLCILSGHEEAKLSPIQTNYIENTDKVVDKHMKLLMEIVDKEKADSKEDDWQSDPRNQRFWCIEKYNVVYKPDGTIIVNNSLILKKIHAGSTAERLLEQCVKNPNKLFKPKLGQTARNLSTVISSAGFKPTLREIFFPIVSDDNGVIFRPTVTRDELRKDRIDTYEIDSLLWHSGAEIAVRPEEELIALGLAASDDDE